MEYRNLKFPESSLFLVTGGAGFIGSNLCEAILDLGYLVRCLDNLSTGKREYVDLFSDRNGYEFIQGDIRDFDTCDHACKGVDYVLHEAALCSVPGSIEAPIDYCTNNITGTLNMMEAARKNGVKKFVYASSSSVYGDYPTMPVVEGKIGELLSPYALTKLCAEKWARYYTRQCGLDTYGLRYFNVYGKRQDPNGAYAAVIPKFIQQLIRGERPTIYGDGTQTRDFTYIQNVVEANLRACLAGHEAAGDVYNVAYGRKETLNEIYDVLTDALGKDTKPQYEAARKGDIRYSYADITKAKTVLGYAPEYDFKRGLQETIQWYCDNL